MEKQIKRLVTLAKKCGKLRDEASGQTPKKMLVAFFKIGDTDSLNEEYSISFGKIEIGVYKNETIITLPVETTADDLQDICKDVEEYLSYNKATMREATMKKVTNKLRVSHFLQTPHKEPFITEVKDEEEAYKVCNVLVDQHSFLLKNKSTSVYSNAVIVEMFEDNKWRKYWNKRERMDWDELVETYFV